MNLIRTPGQPNLVVCGNGEVHWQTEVNGDWFPPLPAPYFIVPAAAFNTESFNASNIERLDLLEKIEQQIADLQLQASDLLSEIVHDVEVLTR